MLTKVVTIAKFKKHKGDQSLTQSKFYLELNKVDYSYPPLSLMTEFLQWKLLYSILCFQVK